MNGNVAKEEDFVYKLTPRQQRCFDCMGLLAVLTILTLVLNAVVQTSNMGVNHGGEMDDKDEHGENIGLLEGEDPTLMFDQSETGKALEILQSSLREHNDTGNGTERLAEKVQMYEQAQAERCARLNRSNYEENSYEYKFESANCGWDYDYLNPPAQTTPWRVVLYGQQWIPSVLQLSGFPVGLGTCPSAPKCVISMGNSPQAVATADVVVVFQVEGEPALERLRSIAPKNRKQKKVFYFREGHTPHPRVSVQDQYDFIMGVHYHADMYNPAFMKRPIELLSSSSPPYPSVPMVPFEQKTAFAMSAISDCHARSKRDLYIYRMTKVLGPDRLHRYGKCGNREMPPKPIVNAAKLISQYKFYLSFENIIQGSYVSEKLFWVLTIPVVPVYYGAPNVPNITTVPSFVNAVDFRNPEQLATYLLYLDEHPEEYNKYHQWRDKNGKYFTEDYLDAVRFKLPGPDESLQFPREKFGVFSSRTSQCCRLCDSRFVQWAADAAKQRKKSSLPQIYDFPDEKIMARFFPPK